MTIAKWIGVSFLLLILFSASYLTWRVVEARAVTRLMIEDILASNDPELEALSDERIAMLIQVEDPTFWENNGWDLKSPGQGITTMTQGLGKRLYFSPFKPGFRKAELMLVSRFALNAKATKQEILDAFLGMAYLGHSDGVAVIGFADGARHWYGKELSALTTDEYLGLVAMLVGPNSLDPRSHQEANHERVDRIKRLLEGSCEPLGLRDVYYEGCRT